MTLSPRSAFTGGDNSSESMVQQFPLYITVAEGYGRLGNHLFQYASTLGIARVQNRHIVQSPEFELRKIFDLKHKLLPYRDFRSTISRWQRIKEARFGCFQQSLMTLPPVNIHLLGYVQSYKYFDSIQEEIRRDFTFSKSIAKKADAILRNIYATNKGYILVGVHVRRGDFLQVQSRGYVVAPASYYQKAFEWMKTTVSENRTLFVIVSEDQQWCQKMFHVHNVQILPKADPEVHLAVLARCSHVIMSGGTFGWWGGWLAGGYVIYFNRYMNNNTDYGGYFCPVDHYPPHWIGIGY
ncbi:unnamed protein product [Candidula unifasciata]|uniref:L-Fucosyltransferase n=1 Tax=Candidula unifasciata TaxID=100452 RepID=A0A8S3ZF52_9EUPU|nr:unnamed protein product [Candidula unifasciata]